MEPPGQPSRRASGDLPVVVGQAGEPVIWRASNHGFVRETKMTSPDISMIYICTQHREAAEARVNPCCRVWEKRQGEPVLSWRLQ